MCVRVFKQLCHENKTSSVFPVTVPAFSLIVPFKYVCVVSEKPPKRSKEKRDVFFVSLFPVYVFNWVACREVMQRKMCMSERGAQADFQRSFNDSRQEVVPCVTCSGAREILAFLLFVSLVVFAPYVPDGAVPAYSCPPLVFSFFFPPGKETKECGCLRNGTCLFFPE